MYGNIGDKMKGLAIIMLIIELIPTVIGFILLTKISFVIALQCLIFEFIIEWISTWALYGFGEIINKLTDIEYNTRADKADNKDNDMYDSESELPQKKCPECGIRHDFDCPKCPNCNHKYGEIVDKLTDIENNTRADKADNKDNNMYGSEIELPQKKCPECGISHDFDCPKCPNCNHKYEDIIDIPINF